MAFDPNNGQVHGAARPSVAEGHYAFRANDFDAEFYRRHGIKDPGIDIPDDPVAAAQRDAFEAAMAINLRYDRTPDAIARAEELSGAAALMATEANLALMREF